MFVSGWKQLELLGEAVVEMKELLITMFLKTHETRSASSPPREPWERNLNKLQDSSLNVPSRPFLKAGPNASRAVEGCTG